MESTITVAEFESARIRVEQAIELFYLDWYYKRRLLLNNELSYRIERIKSNGEDYIRLRYGSGDFRMSKYIARLDLALYVLMAMRGRLCQKSESQLIRLIETCDLPFWFYKVPLHAEEGGGKTNDAYLDFGFVMETIIKKAKTISPDIIAKDCDLDNLIGFYIEDYPSPAIICRPLSFEVDLIGQKDFISKIDNELPKILPSTSRYSFKVEKPMGRYVMGQFLERPLHFYVDVIWKENIYKVRCLNIAGFDKPKIKKSAFNGLAFSMNMP